MRAEAAPLTEQAAFRVEKSFSGRPWNWRLRDDARASELARHANISLSLAQLLCARGVNEQTASAYLNPTLRQWLPEPLLLKDMERAITRMRGALERQEKIAIFGDYDVDGSASTALLNEFLQAVGAAPRVYIPDRLTEGYGPSTRALQLLREEGASLVVCVDCGATAREALAATATGGLEVIVLDHHAVESAPPCVAHVNPNQPDDASGQGQLCATGLTFLFVVGLNRALRETGYYARKSLNEPDLRFLLDLVGLATVCDVVPLVGVNRAYVRTGLAWLSSNTRSGIAALAAVARVNAPFTVHHLGFVFGPRINAGGRVGKCSLGAEVLGTRDRARAEELATLLDIHNRERQSIEKSILAEAVVAASLQANTSFLLVANVGWHSGVVGIVAGRLKERFGKPSFVIGFEGGQGRGSARSIPGVDVGAIVRLARERNLVDGGGGHAMAAGFSLGAAQLDRFESFLADQFAEISTHVTAALAIEIEAAISPSAATTMLVDEFARAGPFGAGNPEPHLIVPDVQLVHAEVVGQNHVRARMRGSDGARLDAVAFRKADEPLGKALLASRGRQIHAAGRLRAEEWNGQRRVELHIEDAAPASA
jgi:single-stranded-DNA-specific exonuclease